MVGSEISSRTRLERAGGGGTTSSSWKDSERPGSTASSTTTCPESTMGANRDNRITQDAKFIRGRGSMDFESNQRGGRSDGTLALSMIDDRMYRAAREEQSDSVTP